MSILALLFIAIFEQNNYLHRRINMKGMSHWGVVCGDGGGGGGSWNTNIVYSEGHRYICVTLSTVVCHPRRTRDA